MTRKIAIINFKGGTGKSTTSISLAHGLALIGKRVLLVDCDPQSAVLKSLGGEPQKNIYDLFVDEATPEECLYQSRSHLDVIFSDFTLQAVESHPKAQISRERILKRRLEPIVDYYDFVLCDCPPEPNLFNLNSIFFADELLLPVSLDYLSIAGIVDVLEQLQLIEEELEHKPRISMVIPTFFDAREKKSRRYLEVLIRHFGNAVARPIRKNVRLAEAAETRQTIFESFPDSYGAQDYAGLVERVLSNDGKEFDVETEAQQGLRMELGLLKFPFFSLSKVSNRLKSEIKLNLYQKDDEMERKEEELISNRLKSEIKPNLYQKADEMEKKEEELISALRPWLETAARR